MERVTRMRAKGDFLLQGPIIMGISAISHRRRLTSVPGQCNENISKRKRVSNRNCHYSPVRPFILYMSRRRGLCFNIIIHL